MFAESVHAPLCSRHEAKESVHGGVRHLESHRLHVPAGAPPDAAASIELPEHVTPKAEVMLDELVKPEGAPHKRLSGVCGTTHIPFSQA